MKFEFSPHIAIQVGDYENACQFYENVLGFELKEKKKSENHYVKDTMNFYIEDSPKQNTFFEFKVESVKLAKEHLLENGCEVTQVFNDKSVMIKDPFGMRFHIWEEGAQF